MCSSKRLLAQNTTALLPSQSLITAEVEDIAIATQHVALENVRDSEFCYAHETRGVFSSSGMRAMFNWRAGASQPTGTISILDVC